MKAFIVYTPDIKEMALECQERLLRFTNLKDINVIGVGKKTDAHLLKLEVWRFAKSPTWMIDADLWFLQPCVLPEPRGPVVFGNPDNSPIIKTKYAGTTVELGQAINTSLVGADSTDSLFQQAVEYAQALQQQKYGSTPLEDEKFFNIAIIVFDLVIARLSTRFNWCGLNPPANVLAVHAASQPNKLQWLREAVKNYERNSSTPDA